MSKHKLRHYVKRLQIKMIHIRASYHLREAERHVRIGARLALNATGIALHEINGMFGEADGDPMQEVHGEATVIPFKGRVH